jgi:hypothetical protein
MSGSLSARGIVGADGHCRHGGNGNDNLGDNAGRLICN